MQDHSTGRTDSFMDVGHIHPSSISGTRMPKLVKADLRMLLEDWCCLHGMHFSDKKCVELLSAAVSSRGEAPMLIFFCLGDEPMLCFGEDAREATGDHEPSLVSTPAPANAADGGGRVNDVEKLFPCIMTSGDHLPGDDDSKFLDDISATCGVCILPLSHLYYCDSDWLATFC